METLGRNSKVGNPIASILGSNVNGFPACVLNPVSNILGFTVGP